jgi:hypothetical protein
MQKTPLSKNLLGGKFIGLTCGCQQRKYRRHLVSLGADLDGAKVVCAGLRSDVSLRTNMAHSVRRSLERVSPLVQTMQRSKKKTPLLAATSSQFIMRGREPNFRCPYTMSDSSAQTPKQAQNPFPRFRVMGFDET